MSRILNNLAGAFVLSLVILIIALLFWYFFKESVMPLRDILFWAGAIPIAIFLLGLGGNISRGGLSYQMGRSVSTQSPNERALQDLGDIEAHVKSGLKWFMAGLLIWLLMYFI